MQEATVSLPHEVHIGRNDLAGCSSTLQYSEYCSRVLSYGEHSWRPRILMNWSPSSGSFKGAKCSYILQIHIDFKYKGTGNFGDKK
ncbi:hypothetical protein J6590_093866 [Homalodisca vitripennis]|nr:hypothetical protein J6590_093866 [Homalodisca vitripennis]